VAGRTEEEIYGSSSWFCSAGTSRIPGKSSRLAAPAPNPVRREDIKGDLAHHTHASDGKCSIEEMAEAARKLGPSIHRHCGPFQVGDYRQRLDERNAWRAHQELRAANASGLESRSVDRKSHP